MGAAPHEEKVVVNRNNKYDALDTDNGCYPLCLPKFNSFGPQNHLWSFPLVKRQPQRTHKALRAKLDLFAKARGCGN